MNRHWIGAFASALLICLLSVLPATAQNDLMYEAVSSIDFHLRDAAQDDSRYIKKVPENEKVTVHTYDEEWCYVTYKDETGFCRTRWLMYFRSLDAEKYQVPGTQQIVGVATLAQDTFIEGGKFKGITGKKGVIVAISTVGYQGFELPVWRDYGFITFQDATYQALKPWKTAQSGDMIAAFTTFYNSTTGGDLAAARQYNIELAAFRIQNTVLECNDTFSYNALCAPYKYSNGYKKAPNISQEGVGYGGGVCQLSTTLYNAVLNLPLQITSWNVHRKSGIDYAPQFFDSAVGSYTDLCFRNTLPYPIRIETLTQEGILTVLIYRD